MSTRAQSGFTLIEITIVMAISSGLAVIALVGFTSLRDQAQFSASVEQFTQSLLSRRQEALTMVKLSGGGDNCTAAVFAAKTCEITLGNLITFSPDSAIVRVDTVKMVDVADPKDSQPIIVDGTQNTSFVLRGGVTYIGSSQGTGPLQVAFVRRPLDGQLKTAISSSGGVLPLSYGGFFSSSSAAKVDIKVQDPAGRKAFVTIDLNNNGITRTFQ